MTLGARWQKRWCEAIRGMRSSSTTRSYSSSSSTWRRGLLAVKAHPAVTGHMTRRSYCTARPLHSRRVSLVRESMQKTGGCQFLPITSRDSEGYAPPQPAQVSTPCTHRLDLRVRKDNARYILDELVRDGTSKAFRTHTAVPRGQTWNGRPGMDRFLALSIQRVPERVSFAIHAPRA